MTCFDRYVVVDWSASSKPKRGSDSIWIAAVDGRRDLVRANPATRAAATRWLHDHLATAVAGGERVLLGVDAALGYPAGFAAALDVDRDPTWRAIWGLLASLVEDDERNVNNRFDVAAALNRRSRIASGPFWGNGLGRDVPGLARTRGAFPTGGLEELRTAERRLAKGASRPQSVWKLSGAGVVGSQTLTLLPRLVELRDSDALAAPVRVWPFETGFTADPCGGQAPAVVVAEVWPSLVPSERIAGVEHHVKDARQVTALAEVLRERDLDGRLGACFDDPGLDDATRAAVLSEEGWILPLDSPERPGFSAR